MKDFSLLWYWYNLQKLVKQYASNEISYDAFQRKPVGGPMWIFLFLERYKGTEGEALYKLGTHWLIIADWLEDKGDEELVYIIINRLHTKTCK